MSSTPQGSAGERMLRKILSTEEGRREYVREGLLHRIAEALDDIMQAQGVSQGELARKLGITKQRASQLASGTENLTLKTIADAFTVLGHELDVRPVALELPKTGKRTSSAAKPKRSRKTA